MKDAKRVKSILVRNLKYFREIRGVTQEEAAERTGITYKYWQRLEMRSQKDLPSLTTLSRMSRALKVKLHQLLEIR